MPLVRGTITRGNLFDKLITTLTTAPSGASEPYWKAIQTGKVAEEGYVLYSKGKSGKDDIYIRLYDGSSTYGYIWMSILEGYKPNPVLGLNGTLVGESPQARIEFSNSSYPANRPLEYFLSFDKDKIMISLAGNPLVHSYAIRTFAWAGMPNRISEETNSNAVTLACSRRAHELTNRTTTNDTAGPQSACYTLRNRRLLAGRGGASTSATGYSQDSIYQMLNTTGGARSKGWGDKIMLPPVLLNRADEGVRSIMSGVHPIYQDANNMDFLDGDEITIGSKRYSVFQVAEDLSKTNSNAIGGGYTTCCFQSIFMAVEHLS